MKYNIVTNARVMNDIKKSEYYKQNLGMISTIEKNDTRIFNPREEFIQLYGSRYRSTIHGQGEVGDIMFYIDYLIKEDLIAFYDGSEEFIFKHDPNMIREKGINFYIGHLIKEADIQKNGVVLEKTDEVNPDKIIKNPGSVTYEDLKEYLKLKNLNRF